MSHSCKSIGCAVPVHTGLDFCHDCEAFANADPNQEEFDFDDSDQLLSSSSKAPHFRPNKNKSDIDVYAIHQMFGIQDCSGCIQHASTKLLLSSDNLTGKPRHQDIREARDILSRWLELQVDNT